MWDHREKLQSTFLKKRTLAQSRKGAKRYRVSKGCLCAFAPLREKNLSHRGLQMLFEYLSRKADSTTAKVVLKVTLIYGFVLFVLQVILLLKLLIRLGNYGELVCESYFPRFQA